jgi:hypothetical protein
MDPLPDGAHAVGAPLRPPSGRPPLRAHRASRASANPRSTAGSVAGLPYHPHIQHEQVETTQMYLHADLALKERALARTTPLDSKPGRYRPPDALLGFLDGL